MTESAISRQQWTELSDGALLSQCDVDTYRASGPGGQKRNKTSSAVRLRHKPSGLMVIAEESRSQHENKAKALTRLRRAFFLQIREPFTTETATPKDLSDLELVRAAIGERGRIDLRRKDPRFWPLVGLTLDLLLLTEARVSETASLLGVSTANLIDFLGIEPTVWGEANHLRARFGHRPLRD